MRNYPLYGKARRFDGARYFAEQPSVLMPFLREHGKRKLPPLDGYGRGGAATVLGGGLRGSVSLPALPHRGTRGGGDETEQILS